MENKKISKKSKLNLGFSLELNHILLIIVTPAIISKFTLFLKTGSIYDLFLTLLMICANIALFIPKKVLNNSKINEKKLLLMQIISVSILIGTLLAKLAR